MLEELGRPDPPGPPRQTLDDVLEANRTLTRILAAIEEYVYTIELRPGGAYDILFAGPCRGRFLGVTRDEEAIGLPWRDCVHPDDLALFDVVHQTVLDLGRLDVEYRMIGMDGRERWVRDRGQLRRENGRLLLDGSVLDTTQLHTQQQALVAARAEAQQLAFTDELTGLSNRRGLEALMRFTAGEMLGLLLIDLDHFKAVNDEHGHETGDEVLRGVGRQLRRSVRGDDAAVRMGGEEFLLVLRGVSDDEHLGRKADSLLERLRSEPVPVAGGALPVTASIGAVVTLGGAAALPQALSAADRALYTAKRAGRDRAFIGGLAAA